MTEVLKIAREGGVATLTLNRPGARNALSAALRGALTDALRSLAVDESIGVVILTGEGPAFCAGNDLKEQGSGERGANVAEAGSDMNTGLIPTLEAFPKPLIAAVNGFAVTAGFELVLACDIIVASESASFADSHVRVGVLPGWGLSQRLPRLIGFYRASEIAFTGRFVSAAEGLEWGLVNRVVSPERLQAEARELAEQILSVHPEAVRGYKQLLRVGFEGTLGEGMAMERERATEFARGVGSETIEARREGVRLRGKGEVGGE